MASKQAVMYTDSNVKPKGAAHMYAQAHTRHVLHACILGTKIVPITHMQILLHT